MKIKVTKKDYAEVIATAPQKHKRPKKPNLFFKTVMKLAATPDLLKTHFKAEKCGMERLGKKEPALYLMNHSSFIDLEIVASLLYPRPFNIVTTSDAFVGLNWVLRSVGCIPTKKFVNDPTLVRDIIYTVKNLKSSVVLYPEASYTFDGTATPIPNTIPKLIKMLGIPVIMIRTYGAFHRDPLYNNLQVRKVNVSAKETYLLSPEEIKEMSVEEIDAVLDKEFGFDNFRWQQENKVRVDFSGRADYLNRVLYKCPACGTEGKMLGKGTKITCEACGKTHILDEYGYLTSEDESPSFTHIPDWYAWERECVREELQNGTYRFECPVDIMMTVDTKRLYGVGEGRLVHTANGFVLEGCDGRLRYEHKPLASYSLYADFNWYEIGDIICIGNHEALYYCLPKGVRDVVAKARLATEEIYKYEFAKKQNN